MENMIRMLVCQTGKKLSCSESMDLLFIAKLACQCNLVVTGNIFDLRKVRIIIKKLHLAP